MQTANGKVLLITNQNPQTQLFVNYIHEKLKTSINVLSPYENIQELEKNPTIILLDADHLNEKIMQEWYSHLAEEENYKVAAFNLKDEDHAISLLSFLHLSGIFYRTDALDLICKGLESIFEGNLWMSRSLMTRIIEFLRKQQFNSYRPACGLTQREMEILNLLGSGFSNMEISENLFVSENTVKSHLYNIFKKIDVNNRIQAANWARQNLGAPPPLAALQKKKFNSIKLQEKPV